MLREEHLHAKCSGLPDKYTSSRQVYIPPGVSPLGLQYVLDDATLKMEHPILGFVFSQCFGSFVFDVKKVTSRVT